MLFVDPSTARHVTLPPPTHDPETLLLLLRHSLHLLEQVAVDHRVEEPLEVLRRDIRDEPCEALAVEVDRRRETGLDEPVGVEAVAVELESGVVED
jgi:hypothetical protein